jgi:hypothetical protein
MDGRIRGHLEASGGALRAAVHTSRSANRFIHLLFNGGALGTAVVVQVVERRMYIETVDTTGYGAGMTRKFLGSILHVHGPRLVCCFSQPKGEYIFGKSSGNGAKRLRNSSELVAFWTGFFEEFTRDIHVWSNHWENISHPYRSYDEMVYFEDDPKSKLAKHFSGSLDDFFRTLLCRADFVGGSLLYARMGDGALEEEDDAPACCGADDPSAIEECLRALDFSSYENALISTDKFVARFGIELLYFDSDAVQRNRPEEQKTVLQPRRKRRQTSRRLL